MGMPGGFGRKMMMSAVHAEAAHGEAGAARRLHALRGQVSGHRVLAWLYYVLHNVRTGVANQSPHCMQCVAGCAHHACMVCASYVRTGVVLLWRGHWRPVHLLRLVHATCLRAFRLAPPMHTVPLVSGGRAWS